MEVLAVVLRTSSLRWAVVARCVESSARSRSSTSWPAACAWDSAGAFGCVACVRSAVGWTFSAALADADESHVGRATAGDQRACVAPARTNPL